MFLELMRDSTGAAGVRPPRPASSAPAPLFDREKMSERGPRAVAVETKPAPVSATSTAGSAESSRAGPAAATLERRGRELLGPGVNPWVLIAAGVGVFVVGWTIGYMVGHASAENAAEVKKQQWAAKMVPESDPLAQPPTQQDSGAKPSVEPKPAAPKSAVSKSAPPKEQPRPQSAPTPPPPAAKLEQGLNYLVVATLLKKDADEAVAYLAANGTPAALISTKKGIDPASAEANNVQWLVLVLKGYAGADFRKSFSERQALEYQAQTLGRKWKAENRRAPTDFSQGVYWWKYEG